MKVALLLLTAIVGVGAMYVNIAPNAPAQVGRAIINGVEISKKPPTGEDSGQFGDVTRADVEAIAGSLAARGGGERLALSDETIQGLKGVFGPKLAAPEVIVAPQALMQRTNGVPIIGAVRLDNRVFIGDEDAKAMNNEPALILAAVGHEGMAQWVAENRTDIGGDVAHELALQVEDILRVQAGLLIIAQGGVRVPTGAAVDLAQRGGVDVGALDAKVQNLEANYPANIVGTLTEDKLPAFNAAVKEILVDASNASKDLVTRGLTQGTELNTELNSKLGVTNIEGVGAVYLDIDEGADLGELGLVALGAAALGRKVFAVHENDAQKNVAEALQRANAGIVPIPKGTVTKEAAVAEHAAAQGFKIIIYVSKNPDVNVVSGGITSTTITYNQLGGWVQATVVGDEEAARLNAAINAYRLGLGRSA